MFYPDQIRFLLDESTSTSTGSGGAPSAPPAQSSSSPPETGGVSSAPTEVPSTDDSAHDDMSGFENDDFDSIEVPIETQTGGEPGGPDQPTPAPAQPKVATAPAPEAPQPEAKPAQAPVANASQPPRSSLEQAIEGFRTNHNELSNWASTNLFALSAQDAESLNVDAAAMIPVLMGRVYSQALQATTNLIKNFVPELVSQGVVSTNAKTARASEALQEFYAANQHLNQAQHGALVDKWARAFRAANPSASRADAIKFVGNAVSAELGMSPAQAGNGASRRPAPFAPARPGARVQAPSKGHDPYEGMDMEYDYEQ